MCKKFLNSNWWLSIVILLKFLDLKIFKILCLFLIFNNFVFMVYFLCKYGVIFWVIYINIF